MLKHITKCKKGDIQQSENKLLEEPEAAGWLSWWEGGEMNVLPSFVVFLQFLDTDLCSHTKGIFGVWFLFSSDQSPVYVILGS